MASPTPKKDIASEFRALTETSATLNKTSDSLTQSVAVLEDLLKKLNLGVNAWTTFEKRSDGDGIQEVSLQIGYCKLNGKWGIALSKDYFDNSNGNEWCDGPWLFGEAPRDLRVLAVPHLGELVAALRERAAEMINELQEATKEATDLSRSIQAVSGKNGKDKGGK